MDWRLYYGTLRFSLGGDPVVGFAEREKILGVLGVSAGCEHPEHGRCIRRCFDEIAFSVLFAVVNSVLFIHIGFS